VPVAVRTARPLKKPANPKGDPRFQRVMDQLKQKTNTVKKHPPAKQKAAEAAKAAKGPPNEKQAGAKANQVDTMKQAKTEEPDPNSFRAVLRQAIDAVMPQTTEDAGKFMKGGKEAEMKESVSGNVKQQKDQASAELKSATDKPPDPSGVPAKQAETIPADPATPPPQVNAAEGMPAPKPAAEISQEQNKKDVDQQMKEAKVNDNQLKKANDPRFSTVLTAKQDVAKTADASPAKYRAGESSLLTQAKAQAQGTSKTGMAKVVGVKNKSKTAVRTRQDAAKAKDEKRRKEVTDTIEKFYSDTKLAVDKNLNSLEADTFAIFDPGAAAAIANFKNSTNREIDEFFDERYSGIRGAARWLADKFRPAPARVKEIIQSNLQRFNKVMDALIDRVANFVEMRLQRAQTDIDKGQKQIKDYVAKLPRDLQSLGKEAEKAMASRFDEMRDGVEAKKNELAQKLAEKYKAAHDQANELAKKIEEENEGPFYRFAKALAEIVKIILEFKDKLMALLRKAADVIGQILDDPIGFLGNLVTAIKTGVNQFVNNIWEHIKKGFMTWLFGSLASAGVEIPSDFSLVSIFKLVMGVLGITYAKMRAKAVKLLGPTAVAVIEKLAEYVNALITGGPAKLWETVKADIGDLKAMVIDAIMDWVINTIIKQATIKLLSFFNPAGAFVQAVLAIYNLVMFLIESASQIIAFIEAVINSVSAIVQGAIGTAANWIEQSLARMIPLVIGFLARLIGLGGIGEKVKAFIKKVQGAVDRAIDKALGKLAQMAKKLFGKIKPESKDKRTEAQKMADLDKAINEAKSAAQGKVGWLKLKMRFRDIKKKYKLTSLKAKGQGKKLLLTAEINPDKKGEAPLPEGTAKADIKEAQTTIPQVEATAQKGEQLSLQFPPATTKTPATAAAATPAAPPPVRKGDQGKKYEDERREQLAQRPDTKSFPTKVGGGAQGIDATFLIGKGLNPDDYVLELVEIKEGVSAVKIFVPKSSGKGATVRGESIFIGPMSAGSASGSAAAKHFKAHPEDIPKVVRQGETKTDRAAKLITEAEKEGKTVKKKMDSELSALTNNLSKNLKKMFEAIRKAASDPTLAEATIKQLQSILAGEGGTLRLVLDIQKGASISDSERELARKLLQETFKQLVKKEGEIKTKLELVLRTVDDQGKSIDETL
jgi:hypothetical protein